MTEYPQTIIALRAENVKRLKAVEIHPGGALVVIGGRNGQGKSSVLDAIEWAFAGKDSMPAVPIRQGEDRATIIAQTQDYVVERRITASGSTVAVRSVTGSKLASPQSVLDRLCSDIALDPLSFLRSKPKDQAAALARLTGIDVAKLDAERKELYDKRTDANRRVRELEPTVLPIISDVPDEEVAVTDLAEKVRAAEARNAARQKMADLVATLAERVEELRAMLTQAQMGHAEAVAKLTAMPPAEDVAAQIEQMRNIEHTNSMVRENHARAAKQADLAIAKDKAASLDAALSAHDRARAEAMAQAKLPVAGLAFDGAGVTFNGLPLAQASSAEQLKVSVAVALAEKPGLRVVIIRDGSLLDGDSLALVAKLAAEAGAQVWVERVSDGAEVGVVIEDGEVAEDRQAPAAPQPTASEFVAGVKEQAAAAVGTTVADIEQAGAMPANDNAQVALAMWKRLCELDAAKAEATNAGDHDAIARALGGVLRARLAAKDQKAATTILAGFKRLPDGRIADPVAAVRAMEAALAG